MKPKYKFHIENGNRRALLKPSEFEEFASWLLVDVQGFCDDANEILSAVEDIKKGYKNKVEFDGMAMLLTLDSEGVIVQSNLAFDTDPNINRKEFPPSSRMELDDFSQMLNDWLRFVRENSAAGMN